MFEFAKPPPGPLAASTALPQGSMAVSTVPPHIPVAMIAASPHGLTVETGGFPYIKVAASHHDNLASVTNYGCGLLCHHA
ncbi:hypothetical protein ACE6H2_006712 [Prunus campanulata]